MQLITIPHRPQIMTLYHETRYVSDVHGRRDWVKVGEFQLVHSPKRSLITAKVNLMEGDKQAINTLKGRVRLRGKGRLGVAASNK